MPDEVSRTASGVWAASGALALTLLASSVLSAQPPSGRWDATVTIGSLRVPFTMHFEGTAPSLVAFIVTGDSRIRSNRASFDGTTLHAEFENPASRLQAVAGEGELKGTFGNEKSGMHPFKATPFCTCGFVGEAGPDIAGLWKVTANDWKVSVRRVGEDTIAEIARGGDKIGPLGGRYNGAFFELSLFDGSRAAVLEIEPRKDGSLDLSLMEPGSEVGKVIAVRAEKAP